MQEVKCIVGCINQDERKRKDGRKCVFEEGRKGLYIFGFADNGGDSSGSGREDGSGVDSGQVDIGGDVKARHGEEREEVRELMNRVLGERWKLRFECGNKIRK